MRSFVLLLFVATLAGAGTLTVTNPQPWKVSQRNNSGVGSVVIAGTVSGGTYDVEASWGGGAYQTIAEGVSAGFVGTLTNLLQGSGTLTVRLASETSTLAEVTNVGVGDVFLIVGQSNGSGRGNNNQPFTGPNGLGSLFGNDYVWRVLADQTDSTNGQKDGVSKDTSLVGGSVWPLVGSHIATNQNVPIAFIPCAMGGSGVDDWFLSGSHTNRSRLFGSAVWRATNYLTGGIKALLWWQGEHEAAAAQSSNYYYTSIVAVASNFLFDTGAKLMPCVLQNSDDIPDGDEAVINDAIRATWQNTEFFLAGPDLSALLSDDPFHLKTDANLESAAVLWWNAIRVSVYQQFNTNAASASFEDVSLAYSNAPAAGVLNVYVPPGNVVWTNTLLIERTNTHMFGAGGGSWTWNGTSFSYTPVASPTAITTGTGWLRIRAKDCSVAGFIVTNTSASGSTVLLGLQDGNSSFSQVFSNLFVGSAEKVVGILVAGGTASGFLQPSNVVIWKNALINARLLFRGDGSANWGAYEWQRGYTRGTTNTVFSEDNFLQMLPFASGQNMLDWDFGGHSVIRYNTIVDASLQSHGVNGAPTRGTLAVEVYENDFYQVDRTVNEAPIHFRGGQNLAYSNRVTGTYAQNAVTLDDPVLAYWPGTNDHDVPQIRWLANGNQTNAAAVHDGGNGSASLVDSGESWTVNQWSNYICFNLTDGSAGMIQSNTATTIYVPWLFGGTDNDFDDGDVCIVSDAYPSRDQIGVGQDVALGVDPNFEPQIQKITYIWGNVSNGTNCVPRTINSTARWIVDGRDYTNSELAYTPAPYPNPLRALYEGGEASESSVTITGSGVTITGAGATLTVE